MAAIPERLDRVPTKRICKSYSPDLNVVAGKFSLCDHIPILAKQNQNNLPSLPLPFRLPDRFSIQTPHFQRLPLLTPRQTQMKPPRDTPLDRALLEQKIPNMPPFDSS